MLSPAELQAARAKAAEWYYEVGMSYLPEGWTHEFRKSLSGMCNGTTKHICGPRPVTRKSLYIWLHECAHAHLHFGEEGKRQPRHVEDMQAEQWAHARMREHDIPVPRSMTTRGPGLRGAQDCSGRGPRREEDRSGGKTLRANEAINEP